MENNDKKIWWFKSHLTIGVMFLFATILIYVLGKVNINSGNSTLWYALSAISGILSIALIIKGLVDRKPDK